MPSNVQSPYKASQAKCTPVDMAFFVCGAENVHMSYRARHFLREWREHKGFTLEELAERVEAIGSERNQAEPDNLTFPDTMTHVTLSRIETGKQPYKQQLLEILAEIYGTDPASLIMRNPTDRNAIWSIYEQLPAEKKQEAVTYLQYLAEKRDGTNG